MAQIARRYNGGQLAAVIYSGKSGGWDAIERDLDGNLRELTAETPYGTVVLSMPTPAQQSLGALPRFEIREPGFDVPSDGRVERVSG